MTGAGPPTVVVAGRPALAATLALVAAFLWSTYFFFVLGIPGAPPSGLLADPFLVGGAAFVGLALARRQGGALRELFADPGGYLRAGLLVAMQVGVLAATYLTGAIDTSLLSLLGDVVATPVMLWIVYREGGGQFRRPTFVGGLAITTIGATLVIGGGAAVTPLAGWAWVVAPSVPVIVALYFLYTARTSQSRPMAAVVGQATLAAGLASIGLSPLLPGGLAGLVPPTPFAALSVVGLGITSFFVAPYLYFRAIEEGGLILAAVLMTGIPVFTLGLSLGLLGAAPPVIGLLGVPIAVVGTIIALRGPHEPWRTTFVMPPPG